MQVLPLVLPIFAQRYPGVILELTERGSAGLEELLTKGEIDLALAAITTDSTNMAYELIEKETIGILAGRDSDIAKRIPSGTPITMQEVKDETFVSLAPSHSSRVIQDRLFHKNNVMPKILLETNALEVGRRVALDAGVCMVLPNIYIDDYVRAKRGCFYPVADYDNHRHFYACYRKDEFLPRYARDFIAITTRMLDRERERERFFRI